MVTSENLPDVLTKITARLNDLKHLTDDCFDEPTEKKALDWLKGFYREAQSLSELWIDPFVTVSAEGEIVFEWQKDHKLLTVYLSCQEVTYVRSWGANMVSEMDEGDASDFNECRSLWLWFSRTNG